MPTLKKRVSYFESEEGLEIRQMLLAMVGDNAYNTESSYSADAILYPDGQIPFVEKHMNYLNARPSLDAQSYINNLRLITRVR